MEDIQDLEDAKRQFDAYQNESSQVLNEERENLEREKENIKSERYKLLAERNAVEEKEDRLGSLIRALDDRDSKLRQIQGTLKEQRDQWQRSIENLQRREDLVDDWQRNHKAREKHLQELDVQYDQKTAEFNKREAAIAEQELKIKVICCVSPNDLMNREEIKFACVQAIQRELNEREQRLQVTLSRAASSEQSFQAAEEKLRAFEVRFVSLINYTSLRMFSHIHSPCRQV
jgi:DNA repair exonuclease SbcCD ATPase subunit